MRVIDAGIAGAVGVWLFLCLTPFLLEGAGPSLWWEPAMVNVTGGVYQTPQEAGSSSDLK